MTVRDYRALEGHGFELVPWDVELDHARAVKSEAELRYIRAADRIPAQRDTRYHRLRVHWTPADDPQESEVARVVSHYSSIALPSGGRAHPELKLADTN